MPWKQLSVPTGAGYLDVQTSISNFSQANGDPPDFALFARTDDGTSSEILLLSPKAVEMMGNALPPTWTAAPDPRDFGWSLLFGHADAWERLGLQTPSQRGGDA